MLDAYVSGAAGRAVFIQGSEVSFADIDNLTERHPASRIALRWLLADANDVVELKNTTEKAAVQRLEAEWRLDRILRMVQIVLDTAEEQSTRREAAAALDELAADSDSDRSAYQTHALPWRLPLDEGELRIVCNGFDRAASIVVDICQRQEAIAAIRSAWDTIPDSMFRTTSDRSAFELAAIELGVFYDFVSALVGKTVMADAFFRAYSKLKAEPDYRAIINSWTRDLRPEQPKATLAKRADRDNIDKHADSERWADEAPTYVAYSNVQRQKDGIIAQLDQGDVLQARRFARELVKSQLDAGGATYAAKSLCSLAQEARLRGYSSLQLEWLEDAVEVCPTDAWAHGQLGDALLNFYRFDEAAQSFEKAGAYGDPQFAVTGHARLLKAKGQLAEALNEFEAAKTRFSDHREAFRIWAGIAETLRDMYRLEEALDIYNEALDRFPEEGAIWCGRATILRDLGKLDQALDAYNSARHRFPHDEHPLGGYAEVLKLMGRFDEAVQVYDQAIEKFPDSLVLVCGRADVFRAARWFSKAVDAYDEARQRFPFSPMPYCGHAETLRDAGFPLKALQAYDDAAQAFPLDARSRNGQANMLKVVGRLGEALAAFDRNVRDFPYDSFALTGRASLLKLLGRYTDAADAYSAIIERLPKYEYARFGLASVYAILWKFDEALALLPNDEPTTRESWIGRHIQGMILVRQKKYAQAAQIFEQCARRTPFVEQKRLFEAGIALTAIRLRDFERAAEHARRADEITGNILLLHSLGALNRRKEAASVLRAINDNHPPTVIQLRDAIAAKFHLRPKVKARSDSWVSDMEDIVLLEAA